MTKPAFKNKHLSVSRAKTYEQCPLRFKLQYIDNLDKGESGEAATFGIALHKALEMLAEQPESDLEKLWATVFAESGLVGQELYESGLGMLRVYVPRWMADPAETLATEQEFTIQAGRFPVLGYMDRVDHVGGSTIRVIDYKSGRRPFKQAELDKDFQLSVYYLAARQLYPWAETIELQIHALRHNAIWTTYRTDESASKVLGYIASIGEATERKNGVFPARIGPLCGYCDVQAHCTPYADAIKTGRLGKTATLQEELAQLEAVTKLVGARKKELKVLIGE